MQDINSLFGQEIKELRKNKKLSQEALAHLADIHRNYLGGIERGESSPSLETLFNLSVALNTKLSDLFEKIEEKIE